MLNLAPYRYEKAMVSNGGPIRKVDSGSLGWTGGRLYQANAYLSQELSLSTRSPSVYEQADGCGTHRSPMVARHMAISEALERWALYHTYAKGAPGAFGLDRDATSCGMAAFPGLFTRRARAHALREAVERWCLAEWAFGRLPGGALSLEASACPAMEIQNPLNRLRVVILWRQLAAGPFAYGFSAARTLRTAFEKARIEMERTAVAIRDYHVRFPGFEVNDLPEDMDLLERRILYFSLQEGHEAFLKLLEHSIELPLPQTVPTPIVDHGIPGPWDRYTRVWRVLYPMPDDIHDHEKMDFFYW